MSSLPPAQSEEEVIDGLHEESDEEDSDNQHDIPAARPPGYGNTSVYIPRRQRRAGFDGARLELLENDVPTFIHNQKVKASHRGLFLRLERYWRQHWPEDFVGEAEYKAWLAENPPERTASNKKSRMRPPGLWKPIIEVRLRVQFSDPY